MIDASSVEYSDFKSMFEHLIDPMGGYGRWNLI